MSSSGRRVSPVAIVLAAALGGVVTGCNLVVASGDYVVGGDGGPTNSTDGALGPDGEPLPPVDGAVPGSDATSQPDSSGPTGDGGPTSGDGGHSPVCGAGGVLLAGGLPTSDPGFQQIVNACTLAVSCDPLFFEVTVSECITNDYLATYPTRCLAGIKSCDDYYTCMGSRIATLAECRAASTADTDMGSCNGSVATSCFSSGDGIISNCATLGGTCTVFHESDFADFNDVAAGCNIVPNCANATDGTYYCAGTTHWYTCDATDTTTTVGVSRQTCAAGSTCETTAGGGACVDTSTSCTTPGTTCANGILTTCATLPSGSQQFTSNCAAAGLDCTTNVSGTSACTAAGCANSGCTEGCVGNKLQVCIGGAPFQVDCPSLGLNTCNSGFNNANAGYYFCSNL